MGREERKADPYGRHVVEALEMISVRKNRRNLVDFSSFILTIYSFNS